MRFLLSLVFAVSLCGCLDDLEVIPQYVDEGLAQVEAEADELDRALGFGRSALAVARVAQAKLCNAFESTCEVTAPYLAQAEAGVADAQVALDKFRETKEGLEGAIEAVSQALKAVDKLNEVLSQLVKNSA